MSTLTEWLGWALHVKQPRQEPAWPANPEYEALLACFRSEQMSAAQLRAHMDEDPAFRTFVENRLGAGDQSRKIESPEFRAFEFH